MISVAGSALSRPWLWLPAKLAHDLSPLALPALGYLLREENPEFDSYRFKHLSFRNRFGIAGGVDKNAHSLRAWQNLGAGFLEVGTVTPKPQLPNTGKIMDRRTSDFSLWNKMGFPNAGAHALHRRLQKWRESPSTTQVPIFVNIGRQRETENSQAHKDYLECLRLLRPVADAIVINISSPNTAGLRDLQSIDYLNKLLNELRESADDFPLLLKLSPDLSQAQTEQTLLIAKAAKIDGLIATNTSVFRAPTSPYPAEGGVSGAPLAPLSKSFLHRLIAILGSDREHFLLVSVGGVVTPSDALERLKLGADLVQTYSGLVFSGPKFFSQTLKLQRSVQNFKNGLN